MKKKDDDFFDKVAAYFFFTTLFVGLIGLASVFWLSVSSYKRHKRATLAQDCLIILNIVCAHKAIDCDKHPAFVDCMKELESYK